ncbi:rRNA processing/ribosome biogenesis-domain-containing protein [Phyllosticta citriasiana]|uniref:rRNA processing/ribosome biogenesis-domain-containing protein n=1 Tax=Phyllosticta citriasiana TaxID=595635 RepID=UPI0030FD65FA
MAPSKDAYAANALKAVFYRISSLPSQQLPAVIPQITALLVPCRPILSSSHNSAAKDASESSVLVHKFRTQISTLLQDRSAEGRWSAVVLSKTAIELGGWEMLQKCGPWVRGLLGILSKPDPPSTKVMAIVTLTRIFMLTRDYQTLVREITTPSLPPFITGCLNILAKSSRLEPGTPQLLEAVLESFARLLPRHPTTFRPHLGKISQFLAEVVASASSTQATHLTTSGLAAARRLFAQLPCCAAKGASKEEWEKSLLNVVSAAHQTANKVFRSVLEEWESVTGVQISNTSNQTTDQVMTKKDTHGFPRWTGIHAGGVHLIGLLQLLEEFTTTSTAPTTPVSYRIAHVMDLVTRVLSVTAPAARGKQEGGMTFNDQIGKEERNDLWAILPQIHVAAISLAEAIMDRFGQAAIPLMEFLVERLVYLFQEEQLLPSIRAAVYSSLAQILPIVGHGLLALQVKSLNVVAQACCDDLLPRKKSNAAQSAPVVAKNGNKNVPQVTLNADSFLKAPQPAMSQTTVPRGLRDHASVLLPILLMQLPADSVDHLVRTRMDQVAVLTRHEEALVSSCLNDSVSNSPSLIPLLARLYPSKPEVEALLRPRLPVIKTSIGGIIDSNREFEEEDESDGGSDDFEKLHSVQENKGRQGLDEDMEGDSNPAQTIPTQEEQQQSQDQDVVDEVEADTRAGSTDVKSPPLQDGPEKRQSEDVEAQAPSPKRARISSLAEDPPRGTWPAQSEQTHDFSTAAKEQTSFEIEDPEDDDEDIEIPSLVMGDDEDEDEDEE